MVVSDHPVTGLGRGEKVWEEARGMPWSLNSVMGGHAQGLGTGISQTVIMDRVSCQVNKEEEK